MMRSTNLAAFTLVAVFGAAESAIGQEDDEPTVSFGLVAGGTVPIGKLRSTVNTGPHAGAVVEFRSSLPGFALRVEGTYHSFTMPSFVVSDSIGGSIGLSAGRVRLVGGSASFVLRTPHLERAIQLYVGGGAGLFWVENRVEIPAGADAPRRASVTAVRPAVSVRLGLEMRRERATVFGEAGYQRTSLPFASEAVHMVPISLGLRLR